MNEQQRVKVYFNLHKKVWSVLHMTPKGWRLWKHMPCLVLRDVTWKVSEAGRQRVIREKRKNVHAFGVGVLCLDTDMPRFDSPEWKAVRYNPYEGPFFQIEGQPTFTSEIVRFDTDRRVFACQNFVCEVS